MSAMNESKVAFVNVTNTKRSVLSGRAGSAPSSHSMKHCRHSPPAYYNRPTIIFRIILLLLMWLACVHGIVRHFNTAGSRKAVSHQQLVRISSKYWPIFRIISLAHSAVNLRKKWSFKIPPHLERFSTQACEILTLYRTVMPIGTPFLKEKINN